MARVRTSRSLAVAGLTGLAVAFLSGCSGGPSTTRSASSPPGFGSSSPGTSATAPSKLEDASADEILARARTALLAARTVHARGAVRNGGTAYTLDLRLVRGVGATGSVASEGRDLGVLRIGKVAYVLLDAATWKAATGSDAAARTFAGKYLKVTDASSAAFQPFLALTDVQRAYGSALAPTGVLTKGSVTTVQGRRVIDLEIDGGASGDVYVTLDGTPYPVRLAYGPGAAQYVDFDQFGAKVVLAAPPASKVVTVPAS
ncbi:MAG TPA: hypothetical protein VMT69_01890 [Kineosporiaceae bacterium]|nr:hypothetical protein [Kineosporiaceae bacterium]